MKLDKNVAGILAIAAFVLLVIVFAGFQNGQPNPLQNENSNPGQPSQQQNGGNPIAKPGEVDNGTASIANPASVYCEQHGGTLKIITASDGSQSGVCSFPDGSECEEWAYFRGECSPANQTAVRNISGGGIDQAPYSGTHVVVPPYLRNITNISNITIISNLTNITNYTIVVPPVYNLTNDTIIPLANLSSLAESDFMVADDSMPRLLAAEMLPELPPPPESSK